MHKGDFSVKRGYNFDSLMDLVKGLSAKEQLALADHIMDILAESRSDRKGMCQDLITEINPERPDCPRCAAKASLGYIVKCGRKNGTQRYYCKSCGRHFFPSTNTAFARSRKDADTWRKFIQLTIAGKSLNMCAEECKLAYQTAFTWRHKILNVFAVNQNSTQMKGTVEVDEMLIPISYKGNHVHGAFGKRERKPGTSNALPRKSYQCGSDNKSKSSKDKACVFCMVENGNKAFFAAVPGVGFMTEPMLDVTVAKHINKETAMMVADDYKITKNYFRKNGYNHTTLLSNISDNPNGHKPEIRGEFHLQHVNAMHHHIRNFLRPYCGVSTKYLSNYISLFIWLKTVGLTKQRKTVDQISIARAATPDCYVSRKLIESRPAVPLCA